MLLSSVHRKVDIILGNNINELGNVWTIKFETYRFIQFGFSAINAIDWRKSPLGSKYSELNSELNKI